MELSEHDTQTPKDHHQSANWFLPLGGPCVSLCRSKSLWSLSTWLRNGRKTEVALMSEMPKKDQEFVPSPIAVTVDKWPANKRHPKLPKELDKGQKAPTSQARSSTSFAFCQGQLGNPWFPLSPTQLQKNDRPLIFNYIYICGYQS